MAKRLWFPPAEYQSRIEAARRLMAQSGIDLLLLTAGANSSYLTGLRPVRPGEGTLARPSYFLLPLEGEPRLVVHVFWEADARATSWLEEISTYESLLEAPVRDLVEMIRDLAAGGRRLGLELGQEQRIGLPLRDFLLLTSQLDDLEFVDAAPLLWQMRMVKSPDEIDCLRRAGEITGRAYVQGFPLVREGMTERQIAGLLCGKMVEHGAESYWIMMTSGPGNYGRISGQPTDRRVERGDMVWVDMGAMVNDYWADFSRAGVVGGPTAEQKRSQQMVIEATAAGVGAVRDGRPGSGVVEACQDSLRRQGVDASFAAGRVGHGIGLLFTEPPSLARWDPVVLEEGMFVSVEPGLIRDDGVFHVEENVLVTRDGGEIFSQAPRELWTLG